MTLPRVSDERRANLFNRANHLRRLCEFDKAVAAYEAILVEDNTEAEAHWGVVLSRYGIEYVEDPGSGERIPTCHRVQMESVLRDADYVMALEHAPDAVARAYYQEQGKRIAEIQRDILAVSAQEAPYDVFVCYKESTEGGSRTADSVLAQEIHHHLTEKGMRVFYAKISLEEHLGQKYEPYIYGALTSARVMVVVGTKAEHFNAVWVRNEWSRFLQLRPKRDRSGEDIQRQTTVVVIVPVEESSLLLPMQAMSHGIHIQDHLPRVLGQAAHPHLQDTRRHRLRIMLQLVPRSLPLVGQLQPVERRCTGQRRTPKRRIQPIVPLGINLLASHRHQWIPPQRLVIVQILIAQSQPVEALQLLHRMVHPACIPGVHKAPGQLPRQSQAPIRLAQQQRPSIARQRPPAEIHPHLTRSQIRKGQRLLLTHCHAAFLGRSNAKPPFPKGFHPVSFPFLFSS
jgi:hypothetical protein